MIATTRLHPAAQRLLAAVALTLSTLSFSCAAPPSQPTTVNEAFFTSRNLEENIDSPAIWLGDNGPRWILSSAKDTHSILVEDATNGAFLQRLGGLGSQLGQFNRPNGVFVIDDLLFVVERDNRRVQVFTLPALQPIGVFGNDVLRKPYGIYVRKLEPQLYEVYVTDNYETPDEQVPPLDQLDRRVAVFEVEVEGRAPGTMEGELAGFIGETHGPGVLRIVESIFGDPEHDRLLIAEEDMDHPTCGIKVYSLDGSFTGQIIGQDLFAGQPEGIALIDLEDGNGYWIFADQGMARNVFHVFHRASLERIGSFTGNHTLNTDGVWFCGQAISPRYPEGVFYAVHNDGNVAAFPWPDIKQALGLD